VPADDLIVTWYGGMTADRPKNEAAQRQLDRKGLSALGRPLYRSCAAPGVGMATDGHAVSQNCIPLFLFAPAWNRYFAGNRK